MSAIPARVAQELGRGLRAAGFQPLPDVDADGELIGTRLWWVRAGYVEYLALRPGGLAQAVRAEAIFDYERPAEHGPVVEHRSGHTVNALGWLLTSAAGPSSVRPPPVRAAGPVGQAARAGRHPRLCRTRRSNQCRSRRHGRRRVCSTAIVTPSTVHPGRGLAAQSV